MTMKIANNAVVSFHYRLLDEQDQEIESSTGRDPSVILVGHRNMLPALEEVLLGKASGDVVKVSLPPEKAYGLRRENSIQRIPAKHVLTKGKLRPGQTVQINTEHGARNVTVAKVGHFNIDIDTNHPLAGKAITFDLSVVDVRDATPEEIAHGHAHGVGGHHH